MGSLPADREGKIGAALLPLWDFALIGRFSPEALLSAESKSWKRAVLTSSVQMARPKRDRDIHVQETCGGPVAPSATSYGVIGASNGWR
jgi:hypothetical protein